MPRGGLPALARLSVRDDPATWRRLGFAVADDGACVVGGVVLEIAGAADGEAPGLAGWALRSARALPEAIDGIPTVTLPADAPIPPAGEHRNGATRLDHIVVSTPDLPRTLAALEAAGMDVRRVRAAGTPEHALKQAFLWAGDVLVEVAGPPEATGDGPARLWGMVAVAPGLDDLPARTDRMVGMVREAVQEGRRIAPVRGDAGVAVPLAFMTPHPSPRAGATEEQL